MDIIQAFNPTFIAFLLIFTVVMLMIILRNQLVANLNQENNQTADIDLNNKRRWKTAFISGVIFFIGISILISFITFGLTISLAYQEGKNLIAILGILKSIFPLLLSLNCLLITPFVPITLLVILGMYHRLSMEGDYWLDRIWKNPCIGERERHS